MKALPGPLAFDWDKGNINKNWLKHKVTNKEAEEAFGNKPLFVHRDPGHSEKEPRFRALGKTNDNKLLFLSFTIRSNKVRVISARNMSKKERRAYAQKTETNTKV